jgi:hypothetical protein
MKPVIVPAPMDAVAILVAKAKQPDAIDVAPYPAGANYGRQSRDHL